MSLSSKLMTILAFVAVFTIVLIAIFAMNLAWRPAHAADDTTSTDPATDADAASTSHSYVRDYIGVVVASVMLVMLVPGFYYANSIGKPQ